MTALKLTRLHIKYINLPVTKDELNVLGEGQTTKLTDVPEKNQLAAPTHPNMQFCTARWGHKLVIHSFIKHM